MKNPQITPPYLRMALYSWLELCRHFLWRFRRRRSDGGILFRRNPDGWCRPSYPFLVGYLLDFLAHIEQRMLPKYWRYWVDIQLGDTPLDVLTLIGPRCASCKQTLICFDGDTILCVCQETEHQGSLQYSDRTKAAIRCRRRYRHLEGELKEEL